MAFEAEDINYESLLDDTDAKTSEEEEDLLVEEKNESDDIPMIPDQESEDQDVDSNNIDDEVNEDIVSLYLKSYGITDPTKLHYVDDDGTSTEVDFNTLSKDEQLTILKELGNSVYTQEEQNTINWLRQNKTNLQSVIDYYSNKAVSDYIAANPQQTQQHTYEIDDYSDDELYMADIKARFPDFTDEEIEAKLDSAKLNEDTFKKEVDSLREYYKAEADKEAEEAKLQEQQQYEALQNSILDASNRFTEIQLDTDDPQSDALEIEDADRNVMLNYLLTPGTDGRSQFDKDLSDPNALIELAWFRTQGRNTINGISQYWKHELSKTRKELAKAQKELAKYTSNNNRKENNVVVESPKSKKDVTSINDLWG